MRGVQRVIVNAERHWQQQSKHGRIVDKDQQDRLLWAYYQMKQQLPEPQQHSLQSAIERQRPGRDL